MKEELIIKMLSRGHSQKEISDRFKEYGYKPNSLSSIEKILNKLKADNNCNTLFQLMYKVGVKEGKAEEKKNSKRTRINKIGSHGKATN